jgi:hypothetical protein
MTIPAAQSAMAAPASPIVVPLCFVIRFARLRATRRRGYRKTQSSKRHLQEKLAALRRKAELLAVNRNEHCFRLEHVFS